MYYTNMTISSSSKFFSGDNVIKIYTSDGFFKACFNSDFVNTIKSGMGDTIHVPFTTKEIKECLKIMHGNLPGSDDSVRLFLKFANLLAIDLHVDYRRKLLVRCTNIKLITLKL